MEGFRFSKISYRCTKLIEWQRLRARLASKLRVTTADSERRRLLHNFLISCTVAFLRFLDFILLSSAAKLAHLSLNYLIQFHQTFCAFIPLNSSVVFWTYDHEAILYTDIRFHCGVWRQEVPLFDSEVGFKALANEDTLLRTHCCRHRCFLVCPRAQHLLRTQILCPRHKKCFWFWSETFRPGLNVAFYMRRIKY